MLTTILWIVYFGIWAINLFLLVKDIKVEQPILSFLVGWGVVTTTGLLILDFRTMALVLIGQICAGIAVGFNKQLK